MPDAKPLSCLQEVIVTHTTQSRRRSGFAATAAALLSLFLYSISHAAIGAAALPDFVELVEQNTPAIVNISTIQSVSSGRDRELQELLRRLSPEDRS